MLVSAGHCLTVALDPSTHPARVEIRSLAPDDRYVVAVEPALAGDGWLVTDPSDPEPTWRQTAEAALDEAISQAALVLAKRAGHELTALDPTVAAGCVRALADIC